MLFHNQREYLPYQTLTCVHYTYNFLPQQWINQKCLMEVSRVRNFARIHSCIEDSLEQRFLYDPSQYQFGSDVTSASFAFNWLRGREATLIRAARSYACCVYTEQALILSDVTTKLLVTWIIISLRTSWMEDKPKIFL